MNHGKSSNSSFMTWQSLKSIDATFSVMLCTCAHGEARLNMPTILGTSLKSLLLWSLRAPFLSLLRPDTPWQGGPAPTKTNPTEPYPSPKKLHLQRAHNPGSWTLPPLELLDCFRQRYALPPELWWHPMPPSRLQSRRKVLHSRSESFLVLPGYHPWPDSNWQPDHKE